MFAFVAYGNLASKIIIGVWNSFPIFSLFADNLQVGKKSITRISEWTSKVPAANMGHCGNLNGKGFI